MESKDEYKKLSDYEVADVKGYEGLYAVSKCGKIYSHSQVREVRNRWGGLTTRLFKGRWKKLGSSSGGYKTVELYKDTVRKLALVHRLVAEAFIPNPDNKPFVNHIDGDKTNNHVSNLEWCTPKENTVHAIRTGLFNQDGEDSSNSKLLDSEVRAIFLDDRPYPDISDEYKISGAQISRIKKGKRWKHLGLTGRE
ncbi:HNH endonuclease signature motif containing protein [Vibrio owensii]|uniref:HNH endonuclease signature motif containing protein n=1 Tax=Vibrio owensii TaxID=696485 RepID=UPI0040689267